MDAQAVENINFEYRLDPAAGVSSGVHVRVTAPLRANEVTWPGEMKWQTGRSCQGQWFLYWSQ